MLIKVSKKWQLFLDIIMVMFGTLLMGFAFSIFLEPNSINTGGFTGIAMIINALLNKAGITFLTTSMIYFALNIFLFFYAFKTLGRKFALKAIIGIASYSLGMEVFRIIPFSMTYEPLISAIYGGAIMGLGVGFVVRFGGSTGGGDMVASIIRNKNNKISVGRITITINMIVIFLSLFVFDNGIKILPYTLIALVISTYTTDFINEGYKQVRAYYIITNKPDEVAEKIMTKLNRGCTLANAKGMHAKENKFILTCLVSKYQTTLLKRIVMDIDSSAFVYSTTVTEVVGSWAKTDDKNTIEKKSKKNKDNLKTKVKSSKKLQTKNTMQLQKNVSISSENEIIEKL